MMLISAAVRKRNQKSLPASGYSDIKCRRFWIAFHQNWGWS